MIKFASINNDKIAIGLSIACVIHCFLVPSFIILSPAFLSIELDNELIHYLMLFLVFPISMIALSNGFKNHKMISYLLIGMTGLLILICAVLFGESILGHTGEKALTLIGAIILSIAHYKNFKTCFHIG
tara:strand:+ start:151 stop:537 length:387 start_codon:yes stop_codon:yes gene_type:complete